MNPYFPHNAIPESEFPEGKIVLLDGRVLDCTPKRPLPDPIMPSPQRTMEAADNQRNRKLKGQRRLEEERKREALTRAHDCFVQNAYFLLDNASRVMEDSRMFLAPVPISSGLMHITSTPYERPTLGVFLEWWLHGPERIVRDKVGQPALLYHFVGSPLSGSVWCKSVRRDGSTVKFSAGDCQTIARSFASFNKRYRAAKDCYEAFSLEEVVALLRNN